MVTRRPVAQPLPPNSQQTRDYLVMRHPSLMHRNSQTHTQTLGLYTKRLSGRPPRDNEGLRKEGPSFVKEWLKPLLFHKLAGNLWEKERMMCWQIDLLTERRPTQSGVWGLSAGQTGDPLMPLLFWCSCGYDITRRHAEMEDSYWGYLLARIKLNVFPW